MDRAISWLFGTFGHYYLLNKKMGGGEGAERTRDRLERSRLSTLVYYMLTHLLAPKKKDGAQTQCTIKFE